LYVKCFLRRNSVACVLSVFLRRNSVVKGPKLLPQNSKRGPEEFARPAKLAAEFYPDLLTRGELF
jgi:hypothetical protein